MQTIPAWWLGLGLVLLTLTAIGAFFLLRRQQTRLARLEEHLADTDRRLETVVELNQQLAQAVDENGLVQASLEAVNSLAGGLGCSFVPLDHWGQPLQAFTFGQMPGPVLKGWAEHLASEQVRGRCEACKTRLSASGEECPLRVGPVGAGMTIACLPLELGERKLGMINIYLPADQRLTEDKKRFLDGLLHQMALAIEMKRMHQQELDTLRQLHRLRAPRTDLAANLLALLQGIRPSLGMEGLAVRVRPMTDDRLSKLSVETGLFDGLVEADVDRAVELAAIEGSAQVDESGNRWSVYPLTLPDGGCWARCWLTTRVRSSFRSACWACCRRWRPRRPC